MAAVLCVALMGRTEAGYDEGMEAFAQGDYDTAYRELQPLAEQGEPGAQFTLGFMYDYGQGVPQSTQEAIWWYRNAAAQDVAVAQFSLGEIYEGGRGTPADLAAAYRWYKLAAENLPPGEIRDSVANRRDLVAGKLTPEQIARVETLLNRAPRSVAKAALQSETAAPRAKPEPPVGDAALVAAIQSELARLGYELEWQIGSLDRLTRGAIQAFEIESGREITGQANEELLAALRATERPGAAPSSTATATLGEAASPNVPAPGNDALEAEAGETLVASLQEAAPEATATDGSLAAEAAVEVPSGAAGGPLIPVEEETAPLPTRRQEAALPTSEPAGKEPESNAGGGRWDLKFVERQIKRLDAIITQVDGPNAAVPGWDALESWERETRGLLAARLGQEAAEGLSAERQAPIVGDPLGNFQRTATAYRAFLSAMLEPR